MAVNPKLTEAAEQFNNKRASAKSVSAEPPAKSKGQKLDSDTIKALEDTFGNKLKDVQIHTGPEAKEANKQLKAKAFTTGNDIFFASPNDAKNVELMAHALAHVVQQGGKVQKGKVNVIK